jgi:hypothetical protein
VKAVNKQMNTKIAILGAGCSCSYGYPLANQMKDHLSNFAKSVETSAPKLHKMTQDTLNLFDGLAQQGCHAQTIDDLAWLVHQGKSPAIQGTFQDEHDYRLVEVAKTAVSAMFLKKESEPSAKALTGYRNFLRRIFPSTTHHNRALTESPWRVLTFNYDRLFELAFLQHFDVDMSQTFYGSTMLNSGLFLVVPEQVQVDRSRFSFLKLHGSGGFYGVEKHGRCNHYHMIPDPVKAVLITDDSFIFGEQRGIYSNRPKPSLIVFPHEKDHLKEYPSNTLPFRFYIPEIWRAARDFIVKADEVWIIGYSVPEPDWASLASLLQETPNDCRIVVQNPGAERIAARLAAWLPPEFSTRITAFNAPFEG